MTETVNLTVKYGLGDRPSEPSDGNIPYKQAVKMWGNRTSLYAYRTFGDSASQGTDGIWVQPSTGDVFLNWSVIGSNPAVWHVRLSESRVQHPHHGGYTLNSLVDIEDDMLSVTQDVDTAGQIMTVTAVRTSTALTRAYVSDYEVIVDELDSRRVAVGQFAIDPRVINLP